MFYSLHVLYHFNLRVGPGPLRDGRDAKFDGSPLGPRLLLVRSLRNIEVLSDFHTMESADIYTMTEGCEM